MNNALWSPRGARAGERNRVTGYTDGFRCTAIYEDGCSTEFWCILHLILSKYFLHNIVKESESPPLPPHGLYLSSGL
jgi:hypothetical protein